MHPDWSESEPDEQLPLGHPWHAVGRMGEGAFEVTRYLISFNAKAMDHIPEEDMPSVAAAAHGVVEEALGAGVYVISGGLANRRASIVGLDGTVTDGPHPEAIGGAMIVDVPDHEEALDWARKIAVACRGRRKSGRLDPTPSSTRCSAGARAQGDIPATFHRG